jgi:hypothetical protein
MIDRDKYAMQVRVKPVNWRHNPEWHTKMTFQFRSTAIDETAYWNKKMRDYEHRVVERLFNAKGNIIATKLVVPRMWPCE